MAWPLTGPAATWRLAGHVCGALAIAGASSPLALPAGGVSSLKVGTWGLVTFVAPSSHLPSYLFL